MDFDYCDTEWFALEMNREHSVIFEIAPMCCISHPFVDYVGYSISSKEFLPTVSELNSPISVHFSSLIPKMSMFTLDISCLTISNSPWFMDLRFQVPFDFPSITSHMHNWALFLFCFCLFFLSRVISPLLSSSILGTYWPGEFIFQCPIFLPFHTIHGVLKARILKWFAIPFSSEPCFVKTLHHDPSILGGPILHGS